MRNQPEAETPAETHASTSKKQRRWRQLRPVTTRIFSLWHPNPAACPTRS